MGLALATAPAALAAPRPGTAVTVAIEGTSPVRVDQDPGFRVTVAGLDNRSTARVNFGDGTGAENNLIAHLHLAIWVRANERQFAR